MQVGTGVCEGGDLGTGVGVHVDRCTVTFYPALLLQWGVPPGRGGIVSLQRGAARHRQDPHPQKQIVASTCMGIETWNKILDLRFSYSSKAIWYTSTRCCPTSIEDDILS